MQAGFLDGGVVLLGTCNVVGNDRNQRIHHKNASELRKTNTSARMIGENKG